MLFRSLYQYVKEHPLTHEMRVDLQEVVAYKDRNNAWNAALASPWARQALDNFHDDVTDTDELRVCLRALGIERSDEWIHEFCTAEVEHWHQNLLSHGWEEFVRLALALVFFYDCNSFAQLPYALELIKLKSDDGGLPAAAIRELAASRLICLTEQSSGTWTVTAAARLSDDTPNLTRLWSDRKSVV